ncbi:MAG: tetratricopeptide repeat protein [Myxococcota bacterium]
MGKRRAILPVVLTVCAMSTGSATEVAAQAGRNDAAARDYFERGRAAFEQADYERALVFFRHAYRLSERPELQYNIGVAADRLQREEEALEAFESYLANTPEPTRAAEVQERIEALQSSIRERDATERALVEATVESRAGPTGTSFDDGGRLPRSTIAGASVLGVVGIAGVSAMAVGLARNGSCAITVDAECTTERSTTAWTYVYGGLGIAALAGSATWFAISAKRNKRRATETTWRLTPTGLSVSGKF